MNIILTEEQLAFRNSILKFSEKELNSGLINNETNGIFNMENWKKCSEFGLLSLLSPSKTGGIGEGFLTTIISLQSLSYGCKDNGLVHAIVTQLCCIIMISYFGSEEQKVKYLNKLITGELIAAQAITEPDAGSDIFSMRTKAIKQKGNYILSGTKMFISNGPIADLVIVFAASNAPKNIFGGLSCFIVERGDKGFLSGKPLEKMGLRTLQNSEIIFDEVILPFDRVLGKEGHGMTIFNESIEWERVLMGAVHIGCIERILETCVKYAKTRKQFGSEICKFQSISNKIVDMKVNYELGKLFLYKTGFLKDSGKRVPMEASITKLFISESLKNACLDAVQIHGAYGYMREYEVERELRDSIASTIYSGTSEIQRKIISGMLGL
jgi:alkylation response protein AidB-like acyl-CoA dehydrogenase